MLSDFRYVLRNLLRNRSYTLVTVLTLAIGIGSAGAIFSAVDWILFRRMQAPKNVYILGGSNDQQPFSPVRYDFMVEAYRRETNVFTALELAKKATGNVVVNDQPVATGWLAVSPGFLPMIGVTPWRGRAFAPSDNTTGGGQVAVVSYKFWQKYLGGRDDALGKKLLVGKNICEVIGVLKERQEFPPILSSDVFLPLDFRVDPSQPSANYYFCLARLAPGVTQSQAQQILGSVKIDVPPSMRSFLRLDRVMILSLTELMDQFARPEVYRLLVGAVTCLYLIACLNASNLMLLRTVGMRRELCIRLALGGQRIHVIRLLMFDSGAIVVAAVAIGLLVANWGFPVLLTTIGGADLVNHSWTEWRLGWRTIGVMALLTGLTGVVISLFPAIRILALDINTGIKDEGNALGESPALVRVRGALVVLQAAFAVTLLAGAGLMIRTFENFRHVELGFDPNHLIKLVVTFSPERAARLDKTGLLSMFHALQAELLQVPGVKSVGYGQDVILPGWYHATMDLVGPGETVVKTAMATFNFGFHETTGIKLRRGRWLDKEQGNEILVNETLAKKLWPGRSNPVGQFVRLHQIGGRTDPNWRGWQVVGVVADIRSTMREATGNFIYAPESWGLGTISTFVVRLAPDYDPALADLLRRAIFAYDPGIVVNSIISVNDQRDQQLWAEREASSALKVLAAIALLLAVVGIFAVLAYSVDRRMNEFGVRMAIGATRRDLIALVMRRSLALATTGVIIGFGCAVALERFLASLVFETSALDPWVLSSVASILIVTSALACLKPALRAAKADVSKLLRAE